MKTKLWMFFGGLAVVVAGMNAIIVLGWLRAGISSILAGTLLMAVAWAEKESKGGVL